MPAKARYRRPGLAVTQGSVSRPKAKRRFSPCFSIASPIRKLPMNRKTTGSENGRKTSRAEPRPAATHRAGASRAVAASGIASVIQSVSVIPTIASRRAAGSESPGTGCSQRIAKTAGARYQPSLRRKRSKRSSAAERLPVGWGSSWESDMMAGAVSGVGARLDPIGPADREKILEFPSAEVRPLIVGLQPASEPSAPGVRRGGFAASIAVALGLSARVTPCAFCGYRPAAAKATVTIVRPGRG